MKRMVISAEDVAALEKGLFSLASEPEWNLAMLVLDRIKSGVEKNFPPLEAKAWARITMAPVALAAAETSLAIKQARIERLEKAALGRAS
jgi:hypothetical protein